MALASELLRKWKFCTELHNAYTIMSVVEHLSLFEGGDHTF